MMQSKPRPSLAIKMKICKILDIAPAFRKYEKRNGSNFVILKIEQIWQLQKVKMRQKFGPTAQKVVHFAMYKRFPYVFIDTDRIACKSRKLERE
ncbi:hypothetical protein Peur_055255 [Populus x canadensis]